ncbi:MAG TPA: hypothetical protein VFT82_00065 [Candidatus Paceibacterota bacterium]|nr:hypothetical protein [Candidatus Paceibacterota bacterium]
MNNNKNIIIGIVVVIAIVVVASLYHYRPNTAPSPVTDTSSSTPVSGTTSGSQLSVTQDDNGKTVTFHVGDRFLLNLGEMNWSLNISDPTVISRVKNIMVIRGAQGIYTADHAGTTVISAEGRPFCNPGEMCAQYIVNFKTTVVVK